jgi:predicted phage terminase large subunit-like protein
MARQLLTRTVLTNSYIPHTPTSRQAVYLTLPIREALFGGAAGGGKSDALLMAALQYTDVPGYAALILRRTYADLSLPGAIMDRAHAWLQGTDAHWNETEKTWTFPSGATLTFGYLQSSKDRYRYQGAEFQFVGFDELTQFPEADYRYLFSRLRRLATADVPIRMRSASNPGGAGHDWVFERFFVTGRSEGRWFVPAKLGDNPHLDRAEYEQSLAELDPITRQQLLQGLWVVDRSRRPYRREWWRGKNRWADPVLPVNLAGRYISWDTGLKDKDTSAYSAAVVADLNPDYRLAIRQVYRERLTFPDLVPMIEGLARDWNQDGKLRGIIIEDKVSGISAYQTLVQSGPAWLRPLVIPFNPGPHGDKEARAQQGAVWAKLGCVLLPEPSYAVPWLADFEREVFSFPDSEHKDQVDALNQLVLFLEFYLAEGHRARGSVAA